MRQPSIHAKLHPNCRDNWNPYSQRDVCTPMLDRGLFKLLNTQENHTSPDLFMGGCLDAPMTIPCGSTKSITCVGGWSREEYNKMPRECVDWKSRARAEAEVGELLRKLLSKRDAEESFDDEY